MNTLNPDMQPLYISMLIIFGLVILGGCSADNARVQEKVIVFGSFQNIESDGEHQLGYHVSLWKHQDRFVGLISGSSEGRLVGDPPTGLIEQIKFEKKTGRIEFDAQMPGERLSFDGVLTDSEIAGYFTFEKRIKRLKVTLKRDREWEQEILEDAQSIEAWNDRVKRLIEYRNR